MTTCKITAHKFQDVRVDLKKALAIRDLELSFDQMQAVPPPHALRCRA